MTNIGISPEYVKGWTIEEAIREIVQNNLDAKNEFDCDGYAQYNKDKNQGIVKDYGPGLEMRHLVMGITEKSDNAVGQFGEGLKLALLVFARENRHIEIWSKNKKIEPVIEYNEEYETDMISLNIEDLPKHWASNHSGTSIKFECTEDELESGKSYFLEYAKRSWFDFEWIYKEDDFQMSLPGGYIWVNGSMVGQIDGAKYSYHFEGEKVREIVNRDRGSVDTEKVGETLKKKIHETRSVKLLKELMYMVREEEQRWEMKLDVREWRVNHKNASIWKRAATEVFGKDVVIADERVTEAQYKGYKIIDISNYYWKNILIETCGIPTTQDVLRKEQVQAAKIDLIELTKGQREVYETAIKIVEENYEEVGKNHIVDDLKTNDNGVIVNGTYSRKHDEIHINVKVLDDLFSAVDTILHETVHKHSGYSDCTAEFEDVLGKVATKMMIKVSRGGDC